MTSSLVQYALLVRVEPLGFGLSLSTSHDAASPRFLGAILLTAVESKVKESARGSI